MHTWLPRLRALIVAVLVVSLITIIARAADSPHRPIAFAPPWTSVPSTTPSTDDPTTTEPPTTEPPTTTQPPTTTAPAPTPPAKPEIPSGIGMWIWLPEYVADGDPAAIVGGALDVGLTHIYVRTGSSYDGFYAAEFLNGILPAAHAAGIRVIGWDFPYLVDPYADVARALEAISYTTPSGDRLDGFSADVETPAEGVALTPEAAWAYGAALRESVGPSYLLIATVPRPSWARQGIFPYPEVVHHFDAIAPMAYWLDVPPDDVAAESVDFFADYGKPVLPIGQAYDGGLEGGYPGTPTRDEIEAFINTSFAHGAAAVSFWSWQHATAEMWEGIMGGAAVAPAAK